MANMKKVCKFVLLVVSVAMFAGCGSGSSGSAVEQSTGRATQSPIIGGIVFADKVVGGVSNFLQDPDEPGVSTDGNGLYKNLPIPAGDYILVSKGGKDSTGLDQMLMLAPKGSANITPLTTLVTLSGDTLNDPNNLSSKLKALQGGANFDSDIYASASPAVLMLVKSVEISVQSLTGTLQQRAGGTLSQNQIYAIQARILQRIAATLRTSLSPTNFSASSLNSMLVTALSSAVSAVATENSSNLTIDPADVASIAIKVANLAVNTSAVSVGKSGISDASTLSTVAASSTAESTIASFAASFASAVLSAPTTTLPVASFSILAQSTPALFTAPTFPVVTLTAAILTGSGGISGSF